MQVDDARAQSRALWDELSGAWSRESSEIWEDSRGVGEWLVDHLAPAPGDTVLELAAGPGDTGFVAAGLIGDSGRLLSTDFAPGMVEAARKRAADLGVMNAEFRVVDAENMDLPDDSVDGILCRWGFMLMLAPAQALRECRRVLRDGGRLSFSVWGPPDKNPWASNVGMTLVAIGEPPMDPFAPGAVFSMSDPAATRAMVEGAGFSDVKIEEVAMAWRFADLDAMWMFLTEVAGAVSPLINALSDEKKTAFRDRLADVIETYKDENGYSFPGLCLNVVAR